MPIFLGDNMKHECDFLVAGAGLASICAAIQAGRLGLDTILIEKEMLLGGNIGTNLGVPAGGAHNANEYITEVGIVEEIKERVSYNKARINAPGICININPYWDEIISGMLADAGVTVLRKHLVRDVTVEGNRIKAVQVLNIENLDEFEITVRHFAFDGTGDACVAAKAGAQTRMGRESKAETGERSARDQADDIVSAASLTAVSVDTGAPCPFVPPPGTPEWNPEKPANTFHPDRKINIHFQADEGGEGPENHPLYSPQELYLNLRKRIYSIWDYMKNTLYPKEALTHQLIWIAPVLGRRESRRIMGDYVLTQTDIEDCRAFEDAVGFGGFFLDWHPPSFDGGYECVFLYNPVPYDIPFRCLYSRNIENLFAGGRTVSGTHIAFTSLRLARTNAALAQATAVAAKFCIDKIIAPCEMDATHIKILQQEILKNDCLILGVRNEDPNDLARGAKPTASSEAALNREPLGDNWARANDGLGVALYGYPKRIEQFSFYLRNPHANETRVTLCAGYGETPPVSRPEVKGREPGEPYRLPHESKQGHVSDYEIFAQKEFTVEAGFEGWLSLDIDTDRELPAYKREVVAQAALLAVRGDIDVRLSPHPVDVLDATAYKDGKWEITEADAPCFTVTPDPIPGRAENLLDGYPHRENMAHLHQWMSEPGKPLAQWIELELDGKKEFNRIHVTFDITERRWADRMDGEIAAGRCVADYTIAVESAGEMKTVVAEKDNFLRFRVHKLEKPVRTKKLRLTVERVHNTTQPARIYEIRLYLD